MRNYFNYFTEIEERFQRRRGSLLLLSTLDWALIETWRDAGIPLAAVLRGIDEAFDKYEARQARARQRRVNGLAWCAQAVLEAAETMKEAATGSADGQASGAPTESAPAEQTARESGFEQQRVAEHLERAAAALEVAVIAEAVCTAVADRLRQLARDAPAGPPGHAAKNLEALERTLTVLEEKLFAGLIADAPEDLLVGIKEQAARELAPYRGRMQTAQLRQVERQFTQKRLLEHYGLPRLSLFYMRQA